MSMHFTLRLLMLFVVISLALPSCISKKKYDELMDEKGAIAESLAESQAKIQQLEEKLAALESEMESEKTRLNAEISGLKNDLASAKSAADAAKKKADAKDAELANLKKEIRNAFAVAGDLTVTDQDGALVVSLKSPVNYSSGSTRLNKDAKDAIDGLAETLKNNPNMNILVEGNTDTDGLVSGAAYRDNWDLSVARAMGVVKRLVKKGVDPAQLSVAGKGEFNPAADNDTAEGKKKNRRTEVKPSPNTGKLWQLGGN